MTPRPVTPRHVLVTGAAGMVGREVLTLLAAERIGATALVLDEPDVPLPADRVVVGDATDPDTVTDALAGADAVIHLAAIPAPNLGTPEKVFGGNTLATFVVLDRAGLAGIRSAAIASSYAICGLPFLTDPFPSALATAGPVTIPYLPIDTDLPLQITDPYALGKYTDEATAAMAVRRHGMTVVAVRLPFIGTPDGRLPEFAAMHAGEPAEGAPNVWSYLDARDAARAMLLSLRPSRPGAHVLYVAADDTLAPYPTEWLIDQFLPGVPRSRPFPGRGVPIDLAPARDLIGFTAQHPWPITERTPPEDR